MPAFWHVACHFFFTFLVTNHLKPYLLSILEQPLLGQVPVTELPLVSIKSKGQTRFVHYNPVLRNNDRRLPDHLD